MFRRNLRTISRPSEDRVVEHRIRIDTIFSYVRRDEKYTDVSFGVYGSVCCLDAKETPEEIDRLISEAQRP